MITNGLDRKGAWFPLYIDELQLNIYLDVSGWKLKKIKPSLLPLQSTKKKEKKAQLTPPKDSLPLEILSPSASNKFVMTVSYYPRN